MNLPRLLLLLLCLSSATGSHAVTYIVSTNHYNGAANQYSIWGHDCDGFKQRMQSALPITSLSGTCSSGTSTFSYFYNYSWKSNVSWSTKYIDCPSGTYPTAGSSQHSPTCSSSVPEYGCCVTQSECDLLSKSTEHSSCISRIESGSNDHFFSSFDDTGSGCPVYSSFCGILDDVCYESSQAGSETCKDFCSIPENAGTYACLMNECFNNPSASHCVTPTPDHCSKNPNDYGCSSFCSVPEFSGYPICSQGGIPETAGIYCNSEEQCRTEMIARNEKICATATNLVWSFDHTTFRGDLLCEFDNGGSAGTNFDGTWKENTSDNVNTPDRTTDNTPDETPEADQLEVADSQVEALNNANKNLNSIESLTRDTNDGLTTISGTLDQIKAAIEAGNNSGGDSGTTDVSGVESRLDAIDDTLSSPAYDQSDWSETGADLQASVDLSQVSFNSTGFLSSGSCPAPYSVQVLSNSFTIDYQPFCDLASIIKAIVLGFAYFWAARIFMREVA